MKSIELKQLKQDLAEYEKSEKHTVLRHSLVNNALSSIAINQDKVKDYDFNFSINIKTMPVTNQKASGRCWIFAATNFLREIIAQKCEMSNFELSQSYIAFYDRLEKVNYTLEAIIELLDKDYDDRTLSFIVMNGIGDGGQWDMFVSIVNKYGLCPKNAFPETATSSGTRDTNSLINFNIRKFASDAKALYNKEGLDAVRKLKDELMKKVYFLLIDSYGVPPQEFAFEYTDKNDEYHLEKGFTPLSFKEKYIGNLLDDYVSLINAPTKDKPFNKTFTIQYLGNVVGGKQVTHLNLPMERLKELILAQLKDNSIVWFGSDVSFLGDRASGIWDDNRFDYLSATGMDFIMDKGESLDYRASQMNHAMCITGVNLIDDKPTKWKIENSWGSDVAKAGYYIMSDSWFDQFVYQAVVNKKYLNEVEKAALKEKAIVLKPWDPMGSLAD